MENPCSTAVSSQNLLPSDVAVLRNLLHEEEFSDASTLQRLEELEAEPTLFNSIDLPAVKLGFAGAFWTRYIEWASTIVRKPVDVVFLTHIILYLTTSVPSAILLYVHYTWPHAVFHGVMQMWYQGAFTLLLHNHIHNNGLLKKKYSLFDQSWPVVLEPLMGHTWHSYYYHHVKHHHHENNGPEDLSSTIRYQRDELSHFLVYVFRFMLCIWIELPLYFWRKRQPVYALKVLFFEVFEYAAITLLAKWRFLPTLSVFIIPLSIMRLGLMIGNWGQHALVDEVDPASDYRTSITVIDEASNRHCFNDGYHTSHHLNPMRHWKDHPRAFLQTKDTYATNQALVFKDIDYLMITFSLLRKNYAYLASKLVPIGDEQKAMSSQDVVDMLRTKTRRFTEDEIVDKFYAGKAPDLGVYSSVPLACQQLRKQMETVLRHYKVKSC